MLDRPARPRIFRHLLETEATSGLHSSDFIDTGSTVLYAFGMKKLASTTLFMSSIFFYSLFSIVAQATTIGDASQNQLKKLATHYYDGVTSKTVSKNGIDYDVQFIVMPDESGIKEIYLLRVKSDKTDDVLWLHRTAYILGGYQVKGKLGKWSVEGAVLLFNGHDIKLTNLIYDGDLFSLERDIELGTFYFHIK